MCAISVRKRWTDVLLAMAGVQVPGLSLKEYMRSRDGAALEVADTW